MKTLSLFVALFVSILATPLYQVAAQNQPGGSADILQRLVDPVLGEFADSAESLGGGLESLGDGLEQGGALQKRPESSPPGKVCR